MTAGRINRRLYSGTGVRGVNCVSDCSHSPSNLAVTRPRFVSPFKQFTCYPHCVHFNYMPSVSLAEGVHIGAISATSAVRLSLSHRRVQLTFIAFKTSRTRRVTLHLCPEGRPVRANLTRQSVATDKVRGHLVQPFDRHTQLCQHFRFDRACHFTYHVHFCRTRLWDLRTFRERNEAWFEVDVSSASLNHIDTVQHLIGQQLHFSVRSHHVPFRQILNGLHRQRQCLIQCLGRLLGKFLHLDADDVHRYLPQGACVDSWILSLTRLRTDPLFMRSPLQAESTVNNSRAAVRSRSADFQ